MPQMWKPEEQRLESIERHSQLPAKLTFVMSTFTVMVVCPLILCVAAAMGTKPFLSGSSSKSWHDPHFEISK